jgi:hypothetical protein
MESEREDRATHAHATKPHRQRWGIRDSEDLGCGVFAHEQQGRERHIQQLRAATNREAPTGMRSVHFMHATAQIRFQERIAGVEQRQTSNAVHAEGAKNGFSSQPRRLQIKQSMQRTSESGNRPSRCEAHAGLSAHQARSEKLSRRIERGAEGILARAGED